MPVFTDPYSIAKQQQQHHRDSSSSSLSSAPAGVSVPFAATAAAASASRSRIYPREYCARRPKPASPHLSSATSPLLSALPNPGDLFNRAVPFPSFLSSSSPSSGAPGSLGSASGGVGLSGGPSPPPSAPASYSSAGGFSVPRQVRGYPGFDEYHASHGSQPGYYNPTTRYSHGSHGSPVPVGQARAPGHAQPGSNGFACELAALDEPGATGTARTAGSGGDNVVLLGWDAGLDVWRVGRGVVEQLGRLDGLRGGVRSAKLLPNPPLAVADPLAALRPLVCLTVHAPVANGPLGPPRPSIMLESPSPYSDSPPSRPPTSNSDRSSQSAQTLPEWETTVEVWSLSARTRVARLFTSPPIPADDNGFGFHAPPPVWGGLRVQVTGTRIVVGVGASGELYVFGLEATSGKRGKASAEWKCLDKVWTAVQILPNANSSFSSDSGLSSLDAGLGGPPLGQPVFSLSDRWLSYCPASAGAFSAGGEVGVLHASASVVAQAPPAQPAISAAVSLEDEAFFNRMAREVTQEAIRGAKWAADTGYKKLQSYWNGSSGPSPPPAPPLPANGYGMGNGNGNVAPTHSQPSGLGQQLRQMQQMGGAPQQAPQFYSGQQANEPRLVSILDLAKPAGQNMPPMATFLPPAGVSFLSFCPGGLALMTASSKGDLIFVWDLMKVVHSPPTNSHQRSASTPNADPQPMAANSDGLGRHIRQVARFARMTVATIVDVDWSSARGDKLAVVTERGTAHFYDLPSGALSWPPPKRPPPSSSALMSPPASAGAAFSNAVNLLSSSTQPLLTAARRRRSRSSSVGSPSGGILAPSRGRTVTASGNGSSPELPAGGDKIPLPPSLTGVSPGCIKFLTGRERGFVAVLGGGLLRIYELRPGGFASSSRKKAVQAGGVASGNWFEYDLPLLPSSETEGTPPAAPAGFWSVRNHHLPGREVVDETGTNGRGGDWLSYAEIETNSAAWVPWHQEKRVKMFVYTPATPLPPPPAHSLPAPPSDFNHHHPASPSLFEHHELSPNPVPWMSEAEPLPAPRPRKAGKKKKSIRADTPEPVSTPSPAPPAAAPRKETVTVTAAVAATLTTPAPSPSPPAADTADVWVFGLPIDSERIFLSENRHGDVEFVGDEGSSGLERAMSEGLALDGAKKGGARGGIGIGFGEEGIFEDDAEMLEYV